MWLLFALVCVAFLLAANAFAEWVLIFAFIAISALPAGTALVRLVFFGGLLAFALWGWRLLTG